MELTSNEYLLTLIVIPKTLGIACPEKKELLRIFILSFISRFIYEFHEGKTIHCYWLQLIKVDIQSMVTIEGLI